MQVQHQGIINSNLKNFCSPNKFANPHIARINPDKSTFLNSNLLCSNILNNLPSQISIDNKQDNDAYANREEEMKKYHYSTLQRKDKINRVKFLAKCRSQTTFEEMRMEEEERKKQVEQVNEMRIEMNEKARDIMSRKEDTAYLGRNLFLEGQKYLKQMKTVTPATKINKIEATRMLMKDRAKSKGRALRKQMSVAEDCSDVSNMSMNQNQSMNTSSLDVSSIDSHRRKDVVEKEKAKDQHIAKMIKNSSFESVLSAQKRHAAWESFNEHWALGFKKNQDLIITKKKTRVRKSPKQKYLDISDCSGLEYHDKMSRHTALKKYKETFDRTAATYQIVTQ